MPRRSKRRTFMPMSTAGLLSFSQEYSGGLRVPKWFPLVFAAVSAIAVVALHLVW